MSKKTEIKVSCIDQAIKVTNAPVLASGGLNEARVVFTFCEKWDGFAKTGIFYREEGTEYYAVLDENDTCILPNEVYKEPGYFNFFVLGEKYDIRRTSSTAKYKSVKGAVSSSMLPSDPSPEVYDQIMSQVAHAIEQSKSFRSEAMEVIEATEQATANAKTATEAANTSAENANRATENANKATENASNASTNANTAAKSANDAAANTIAAITNANTATNNATEAAENANRAANNANTATTNANSAAAGAGQATLNAQTATTRANASAENADIAAECANTSANTANTEAEKAKQAAENANVAITNANNAAEAARVSAEETNTARENLMQSAVEALETIKEFVQDGEYAPPIVCSAVGDFLKINDSANRMVRGLKLFGKTTQVTTTGKNLLELTTAGISTKGITFTVNNDGSVTANGTAESTAYFLIKTFTYGEGNYILSGCPEGGGNGTYRLYDQDAGKYDLGKGVEIEGEHTGKIYISVAGGLTVSNLTFYPMIRHASITDATYEPYTGGKPSSSPDYPQELVSAGASGSIKVQALGGQLIPKQPSLERAGVTVVVAEDGTITFTGTSIGGFNYNLVAKVLPAGTYHITWNQKQMEAPNLYVFNGTTNKHLLRNTDSTFITNGKDEIVIFVNSGPNMVYDGSIRPMLNAGETALPYEPYKEPQTLTASTPNGLPGIPVTSGGNYTDAEGQQWICDVKDFANGLDKKNVVTLTDFSKLRYYAEGDVFYFLTTAGYAKYSNVALSTHYRSTSGSASTNQLLQMEAGTIRVFDMFYIKDTRFNGDTIEDFRTWLTENGVVFMAKAATPIETPLSEEELAAYAALHTNNPNTTVYNDAGAHMELSYNADTKTYIDNKFAELAAAIVNNA